MFGVSSITCDIFNTLSWTSQVRKTLKTMSGFPGLSFIGPKSKNAVVAGGLTAFVFGVYFYTMKAVGGTDELQMAIDKFEDKKQVETDPKVPSKAWLSSVSLICINKTHRFIFVFQSYYFTRLARFWRISILNTMAKEENVWLGLCFDVLDIVLTFQIYNNLVPKCFVIRFGIHKGLLLLQTSIKRVRKVHIHTPLCLAKKMKVMGYFDRNNYYGVDSVIPLKHKGLINKKK